MSIHWPVGKKPRSTQPFFLTYTSVSRLTYVKRKRLSGEGEEADIRKMEKMRRVVTYIDNVHGESLGCLSYRIRASEHLPVPVSMYSSLI